MSESSSPLPPAWDWRSPDGKYGVQVEPKLVEQMLRRCELAGPDETGGILIGRYSPGFDLAQVTKVSGPPKDSRAGRTFFERGTNGLQRLLDRLWHNDATYYLGEWHFHPGAEGVPSSIDHQQMNRIATSESFRCPEPILLIVGGRPPTNWTIRAFVYPSGHPIELEAGARSVAQI